MAAKQNRKYQLRLMKNDISIKLGCIKIIVIFGFFHPPMHYIKRYLTMNV